MAWRGRGHRHDEDEEQRTTPEMKDPKEKRPVHVNAGNRPPGDPGPDVDIQEHVGGQPGREDPGLTGGPSHEDVGAERESDEPSPSPEAGKFVRKGADEHARRESEKERQAAMEDREWYRDEGA